MRDASRASQSRAPGGKQEHGARRRAGTHTHSSCVVWDGRVEAVDQPAYGRYVVQALQHLLTGTPSI
jgi:hypothetical protein